MSLQIKVVYPLGGRIPVPADFRKLLELRAEICENMPRMNLDVAFYEDDIKEITLNLNLVKPVTSSFEDIVFKWCDSENFKVALQEPKLPEWWLEFNELKVCKPLEKKLHISHNDIKVDEFAFGSFLKLNTFVRHYSSQQSKDPSCKITQTQMSFDNSAGVCFLYFVDKQSDISSLRYRFVIKYSSICRIIVQYQGKEFVLYLHLHHPTLLYNIYSRQDKENNTVQYVSQSEISVSTEWARAHEFGKNDSHCSSEIIGGSRVLKLILSSKKNWEVLSALILNCRSAEVYYSPVLEFENKTIQKPVINVKNNFSCVYALMSVWSCSFQVQDDVAFNSTVKEISEKLTNFAKDNITALEETLFELYFSVNQCKIVSFMDAITKLFIRHKKQRESTSYTGSVLAQDLPNSMVAVRKVVLTPTRIMYLPPQLLCRSRLLKHFSPDYAMRVVVRDDDYDQLSFTVKKNKPEFLNNIIKKKLLDGFKIGKRRYEFLGCSSSQIKEHGMWYYSRDENGHTAADIRAGIGDLSGIHVVPKYMARIGQAFSQAIGYVTVPKECTSVEEDVKLGSNNWKPDYVFSDGVGRISSSLMKKVYEALELPEGEEPSAIQIRYGGCKGMLALDPTLKVDQIVFRESMMKFPSDHEELYILKTSKPRVVYLNRPMITILENRNIVEKVFLELQMNALDAFINAMFDDEKAARILNTYSSLRLPYRKLADAGLELTAEPFFRSMIRAIHRKALRELKTKARIPIPPDKGRTMFGIMDETNTLNYGEVFIQYSEDLQKYKRTDKAIVHEGDVIVTKNPCMHPGDIRKLKAVDVPELHHIRDCIVFPARGERPHPDEMAGSDLDGDEYSIIWYSGLIFESNAKPMDYHFSHPTKEMKRKIEVPDMLDFFCEYLRDNNVGLIARAHLAWADLLDIESNTCMSLAKKFSLAVDFAKSGTVKSLSKYERPPKYPDFLEKFAEKDCYSSKHVLGSLFHKCNLVELAAEAIEVVENALPDSSLLLEGREKYAEDAERQYDLYTSKIKAILKALDIASESELYSGALLNRSKYVSENQNPDDADVVLETQITHVMKTTREIFQEGVEDDYGSAMLKASAWYEVIYKRADSRVSSFPWIVSDILLSILKNKQSTRSLKSVRNSLMDKLNQLVLPETIDGIEYKDLLLNNSFKVLCQWVESNQHMLSLKTTDEVKKYQSAIRNICHAHIRKITSSTNHSLLERQPGQVVTKTFQYICGLWTKFVNLEKSEESIFSNMALITFNCLALSGNINYLNSAGSLMDSLVHEQQLDVLYENIRYYLHETEYEFIEYVEKYYDIFNYLLLKWCKLSEIESCTKKDGSLEKWYLLFFVKGTRKSIEELKELTVYGNFQKIVIFSIKEWVKGKARL